MTAKEITFRHWFLIKFGEVQLTIEERVNYIKPAQPAEIERLYITDLSVVGYKVPTFNSLMKYADGIENEVKDTGTYECPNMKESVSFEHIEGARKGVLDENGENIHVKKPEPYVFNPIILDDMEDKEPRLMRTGTIFDRINSDFAEDGLGGLYGGTVTICTGESGSGKTTLLADFIAKLMKYHSDLGEDFSPMYVSSEMTRNDLQFYCKTTPKIGKVPTILVMDYIRKGQLMEMLEDVFTRGYDYILLDSLQDTIGKLMDTAGMTEKQSMRWLIDLMLQASEDFGTAVFAIQHLTKSGTYVGSTYLKHTTTAMLELWIDKSGKRYAYYSKNRRGGTMQKKPVFFYIENGEIVFDEKKFNDILDAEKLAKADAEKRDIQAKEFLDILKHRETAGEGKESDDAKGLNLDDFEQKIEREKAPEPKTVSENETTEERPSGPLDFGDAINNIAEDVDFQETTD